MSEMSADSGDRLGSGEPPHETGAGVGTQGGSWTPPSLFLPFLSKKFIISTVGINLTYNMTTVPKNLSRMPVFAAFFCFHW